MKDRLQKLLKEARLNVAEFTLGNIIHRHSVEALADHLLANGVIVQAQGRWVTEGKIFYCSNCRFTRNIEVYINHRYCPHCGAKMERSNENG